MQRVDRRLRLHSEQIQHTSAAASLQHTNSFFEVGELLGDKTFQEHATL
jgi:hypothetical protein